MNYRETMELYYKWLFSDPSSEPPTELVISPHLTQKIIVTSFLMNPQLSKHLEECVTKYNVYNIDKGTLLKRIKKLVQRFKVSKYDFWTLMDPKPFQDPLFKELYKRYWIKPSDVVFIRKLFSKEELQQLVNSKPKKIKKKDIFDLVSESKSNKIYSVNQKSAIEIKLQKFKEDINTLLQSKYTNPIYEGCRNCSLRMNPYVPPDYHIGNPNRNEVDIVFIGMNPYKDEIKPKNPIERKPFVGRSGQYFRSVLKEKCADINYVITNTCMCFIPDNGDPTPDNIYCCKPLLLKQIKDLNPKVVMPLGSLAVKVFINPGQGITKICGNVYDIPLD